MSWFELAVRLHYLGAAIALTILGAAALSAWRNRR